MTTTKPKILVTSALPYANGSIHLGHLVEYIQTDIFVRALKLFGEDAIYCCADDTHGTPIELKAKEQGIKPEQLIAKVFKEHTKDFSGFQIEFDSYYSTNSKENKEYSDKIFIKLLENDLIYKKKMDVIFCEECKRFLPDRFVKGKCPKCGAEDQYGDVCEKCSTTHKTTDLIDPKCSICSSLPVVKESEHYFFKLSKLSKQLEKYLKTADLQEEIINFCKNWLKELKDWCISRDGPYFGFKIPGEDDKYYYVWLDAPVGYIASTANYCKNTKRKTEDYWKPKNPKDSKIIHVIGKDIIYFHFLFWPAMLMNSGFKTPDKMVVHGFLTVNKEKMSKSRGTFITAKQYLEHLDPMYLRFYYAAHLSSKMNDLDLDLKHFKEIINSELVGNIANLAYRSISFTNKNFNSKITKFDEKELADEIIEIKEKLIKIKKNYELFNFKNVINDIMHISSIGNKYFQEKEPWKLVKQGKEKEAQEVLTFSLNILKNVCIAIKPILPLFAGRLEKQLNLQDLTWDDLGFNMKDCKIGKAEILVKKIEDECDKLIIVEKKEEESSFPLDLRVGKIIDIKQHPDADNLYIETVDLGTEKRTIVSGIKEWYSLDELKNKKVVVVCNLMPAKLRGIESQGMLLTAEYKKDGKKCYKLLELSKSKPGDMIYLDKPGKNFKQLEFKEFSKVKMSIKDKKIIIDGKALKTNSEEIIVDVKDGSKVY